ncbi:hypothetical protein [Microbacterium cremeum]|uniref:hypothetical protein n=1 Tax=Microbacterium cremeum TaxID=2782169 RepID=UPI0018896255|nr:hypothetical protein [Microbacterium cremeum]
MEFSFEMPIAAFTFLFVGILLAVPAVALVATRGPAYGHTRAHAYSVRARLPFGSELTAGKVASRLRTQMRANMWALLGVMAVTGLLLLNPGVVASPQVIWVVTVTMLMCALSATAVVVNVRGQLFEVAPAAPRVAHVRDLTIRDYLQPWRRLPAPLLLVAAAGSVVLFGAGEAGGLWRAPSMAAVLIYSSMALALVVAVGTRVIEARVLAQPRRAHDELELAWNDIFRADTLGALRMSTAVTAWLPLGLSASFLIFQAVSATEPTVVTFLQQFPWWGVCVLQALLPLGQGTMPAALYPPPLRSNVPPYPIAMGGPA